MYHVHNSKDLYFVVFTATICLYQDNIPSTLDNCTQKYCINCIQITLDTKRFPLITSVELKYLKSKYTLNHSVRCILGISMFH